MPGPIKLTKSDARRALVTYHFTPCATQMDAFERLRSIQFDPIAPVGCNHDLVLQARVPGYRVGDWEKIAYEDRLIYDGWDKQASLVPFTGWQTRRFIHALHEQHFQAVVDEYPDAAAAILKNLEACGPLMPKECEFQERRADWKSSWYSPNVTKRVLRGLWHTGRVMTSGRRNGQHLYDLPERVVPAEIFAQPPLDDDEARLKLMHERHQAVGLIRPSASAEMWSYQVLMYHRKELIARLLDTGDILAVDIEGITANVTPAFLSQLDSPPPASRVVFVAPLDQILWDRKLVQQLFGFDYVWEIYMPEAKRRWGYYILPVLFGEAFVARIEFWCRDGVLTIRKWHWESSGAPNGFFSEFERALRGFMAYCRSTSIVVEPGVDTKVRDLCKGISRKKM